MNTQAETHAELSRDKMEIEKIRAEIMNLISEAHKMQAETKFYPIRFVGGVAIGTIIFAGALIGLIKAFLS